MISDKIKYPHLLSRNDELSFLKNHCIEKVFEMLVEVYDDLSANSCKLKEVFWIISLIFYAV